MKIEQEIKLIELSKKGSFDAWGNLMRKYRPKLLVLCKRFVSDEHLAEDICQDTMYKAFHKIDRLKNPKSLLSWMTIIARRMFYDHLKLSSNKNHISSDFVENVSDQCLQTELEFKDFVNKALAILTPKERDVILKLCLLDYTTEETADILEMKYDQVRWIYKTSIKKLYKFMKTSQLSDKKFLKEFETARLKALK